MHPSTSATHTSCARSTSSTSHRHTSSSECTGAGIAVSAARRAPSHTEATCSPSSNLARRTSGLTEHLEVCTAQRAPPRDHERDSTRSSSMSGTIGRSVASQLDAVGSTVHPGAVVGGQPEGPPAGVRWLALTAVSWHSNRPGSFRIHWRRSRNLPAEDQATRVTSERWPVPGTKRSPAADSFLMYSASPLLAAADASIAAASAPIPIHVN